MIEPADLSAAPVGPWKTNRTVVSCALSSCRTPHLRDGVVRNLPGAIAGAAFHPPVAPARAELLHVLMLPDLDRAERIGDFWANPKTRTFGELLIDCEEDRTLRAVLVGKQ